MLSKTILILGGGVGGLVVANQLRDQLSPDHKIIIIDREATHLHNPSLLWVMLGWRKPEQVQRNLSKLSRQGIEFVQAEIEAVDPVARTVQTSVGEFSGDYLIVSLGAQVRPDLTPGFIEGAHTPYTLDGANKLHDALVNFKAGRLLVVVTGLPYKCPAAPYETAIMLHAYLEKRGIRESTDLQMITPEGMPMATAGLEMAQAVEGMMAERDIQFRPLTATKSIDAEKGELQLENGERIKYDLLVGIPPHRSPKVIQDTDLVNEGGWVSVDVKTFSTSFEKVYAIGDITTVPLPGRFKPDQPLVLPKAGIFAHAQAEVVAKNIVAEINRKTQSAEYDGVGGCFIELGDGRAAYGEGDFYGAAAPDIKLQMPSRTHHRLKAWFETYWLWRWFSMAPSWMKRVGDRIIFGK